MIIYNSCRHQRDYQTNSSDQQDTLNAQETDAPPSNNLKKYSFQIEVAGILNLFRPDQVRGVSTQVLKGL